MLVSWSIWTLLICILVEYLVTECEVIFFHDGHYWHSQSLEEHKESTFEDQLIIYHNDLWKSKISEN